MVVAALVREKRSIDLLGEYIEVALRDAAAREVLPPAGHHTRDAPYLRDSLLARSSSNSCAIDNAFASVESASSSPTRIC